jgi:hypothetical protein
MLALAVARRCASNDKGVLSKEELSGIVRDRRRPPIRLSREATTPAAYQAYQRWRASQRRQAVPYGLILIIVVPRVVAEMKPYAWGDVHGYVGTTVVSPIVDVVVLNVTTVVWPIAHVVLRRAASPRNIQARAGLT